MAIKKWTTLASIALYASAPGMEDLALYGSPKDIYSVINQGVADCSSANMKICVLNDIYNECYKFTGNDAREVEQYVLRKMCLIDANRESERHPNAFLQKMFDEQYSVPDQNDLMEMIEKSIRQKKDVIRLFTDSKNDCLCTKSLIGSGKHFKDLSKLLTQHDSMRKKIFKSLIGAENDDSVLKLIGGELTAEDMLGIVIKDELSRESMIRARINMDEDEKWHQIAEVKKELKQDDIFHYSVNQGWLPTNDISERLDYNILMTDDLLKKLEKRKQDRKEERTTIDSLLRCELHREAPIHILLHNELVREKCIQRTIKTFLQKNSGDVL